MLCERIFLDSSDENVYIDAYIANRRTVLRDAMLVIPGGGYHGVCSDREGEPIALAFLAKGYNCFVLNYRVGADALFPNPLVDASRAILHIRENAEKYCISPDRVFAVGFSAGGHLAGSLATLASYPEVLSTLGIEDGANRPNAVILAYPVVTALLPTHEGSFVHLSGKKFSELTVEDKIKLSLECHVDEKTSPAFIWHTAEDKVVPACGSLELAREYVDAGIPVSMKLYPYGGHGLALANRITAGIEESMQPIAERWIDEAIEFLNTL